MFVASAVLPIEGLPGRIIRSEFCNPPSMLSKSPKPETIPEYCPMCGRRAEAESKMNEEGMFIFDE